MHYSFIVRVYRHEKNNPRMLVGTVEKVGKTGRSAFTNIDELWEIVNEGTDIERIMGNAWNKKERSVKKIWRNEQ